MAVSPYRMVSTLQRESDEDGDFHLPHNAVVEGRIRSGGVRGVRTDNITQSAPSVMAFPTSDTSARVGRGFLIILSSYNYVSMGMPLGDGDGARGKRDSNHLGSANDGFAGDIAHGNKLLLRGENLGGRDLDTQITTSYHDL